MHAWVTFGPLGKLLQLRQACAGGSTHHFCARALVAFSSNCFVAALREPLVVAAASTLSIHEVLVSLKHVVAACECAELCRIVHAATACGPRVLFVDSDADLPMYSHV